MTKAQRRRPRRQQRSAESGLTLVEMLVTIAIITVGVLGITSGLAQSERIAGIYQDQSQLEVAMRQIADYVRDSSSQGLTYVKCATPSSYALPPPPPGMVWSVTTVSKSTDGTRTSASGLSVSTAPLQSCGAGVGDWGVQKITVSVSSGQRSLTRTVWKSIT